jgi:hypothetical protein
MHERLQDMLSGQEMNPDCGNMVQDEFLEPTNPHGAESFLRNHQLLRY